MEKIVAALTGPEGPCVYISHAVTRPESQHPLSGIKKRVVLTWGSCWNPQQSPLSKALWKERTQYKLRIYYVFLSKMLQVNWKN